MDFFLSDDDVCDDEFDETLRPPPRDIDWWKDKTALYLQSRREDLAFVHDHDDEQDDQGYAYHAATAQTLSSSTAVSREIQERWFVTPQGGVDGSLFGIPPPGSVKDPNGEIDNTPPPESLYASFQPKQPESPNAANPLEKRNNCQELVANLNPVAAGLYNLFLRVKTEGPTVAQLVVHVKIRYEAERGVRDTVYSKLRKDISEQKETESGWHYLMTENQIEVRPHEQAAKVNIRIMRDENSEHPFQGKLWTRSVELVPVGQKPIDKDASIYTTRIATPDFTITTDTDERSVVTRLAHSKDGNYLAALRLVPDGLVVQVWQKADLGNLNKSETHRNVSTQGASYKIGWAHATKTDEEHDVNAHDLSLGLSISANGNQLAVYQMPHIGSWQDGSEVPMADFKFHVFRNPLASGEASVNIPNEQLMQTIDGDVVTAKNQLVPLVSPVALESSIGYASYVGQYEDDGGNVIPPKFIFCNGYYLDVFEVNDNGLVPLHTISLKGLTPTVSRRFACETTMGSICENMFLWVEDGGRYCSTWDLFSGSAIKRLKTSRWRYDNANSKTTMSIARSQNIVAIVGFDNSITTFFADSGIQISRRLFMNQRIEFIGFASNQSTELFVVLRERSQEEFSSRTLDPLRLDIEVNTQTVPIPIRSSIFCHFGLEKDEEIGVVCQPEGNGINFYHLREPRADDNRGGGQRTSLQMPTVITASNGHHYQLTIRKANLEDTPLGGEELTERLVEIWRISENPPTPTTDRVVVFSFVPEPWEQQAISKGFFLSTGDRFLVHANRTLQVWSLPTEKESCKLLYFWSLYQPQNIALFNKTEMEVVLTEHKRFDTVHFYDYPKAVGQTRIRANVVPHEMKDGSRVDVRPVHIPNSPMRRIDHRNTTENCFQSIRLLALAYSIVSSGYEETQDAGLRNTTHAAHARAILNFINRHINYTNYTERFHKPDLHGTFYKPKTEKKLTTIWTHFLTSQYLPTLSATLVKAILEKEDCAWIPRKYESINPIQSAIDRKNSTIIEAFVDFCVQKTIERHPAYMHPVVQCFHSLAQLYPEILRNLLKNSSYIPAQSIDFHKSHVNISGFDWRAVLRHENKLEDFAYPVFSHHLIILKPSNDLSSRIKYFPKICNGQVNNQVSSGSQEIQDESEALMSVSTEDNQNIEVPYDNNIYVAPFPRLSMYGTDNQTGKNKGQSQFSHLAGKDFFDNPAMMAVLRFKWWMYGFWYWLIRFAFLLLFYGIFVAVTIYQMQASSSVELDGRTPSEMLSERYMDPHPWRGLIGFDLFLGAVFIFLELFQLHTEGFWLYFLSLFNWVDVVSIALTMACQVWVLIICVKEPEERDPKGPERIELIWLAIISMYLHLLFELRVYRPLGIIVNIIIRITRRIAWFFIIFAIMIVGFTHALIHVLNTKEAECKPLEDGTKPDTLSCEEFEPPSSFPAGFFEGISGTLFFLAGRYDFVEGNFEQGDLSFHLLMIIFYFFTGLVLLNVLIALMNDAYNQCSEEGQLAWLKQWSKVLDEVEMIFLRHFQTKRLRNLFPDYIYYAAPTQDADTYRAELMITNKESLSSENLFMHECNLRQTSDIKKKVDMLEEQLKRQTEMLKDLIDSTEGVRRRRGSSFVSFSSSIREQQSTTQQQ